MMTVTILHSGPFNRPAPVDKAVIKHLVSPLSAGVPVFYRGSTEVRITPWRKMFNSFGFITFMVFFFAFLSTMVFPSTEADRKWAVTHTPGQSHGTVSFEPLKTDRVSQQDETIRLERAVRGPVGNIYQP
jgi:hypothetical protein